MFFSRRISMAAALSAALFWLGAPACDCNGTPDPPPPDCPAGTLDCPCNAGACNSGLECREDKCQTAAVVAGFAVSDANARSCELLLDNASDVKMVFDATVTGRGIHEGNRLAVAFVSATDVAIAAGAVKAERAGGSLAGLTISTSRCFDRNGAPLAGATVTLQQ